MLRSAAKNHESVTVVMDPNDYEEVVRQIREHGGTSLELRRKLAMQVYARTSAYDATTATQYQTAIIPLESPTAALATSETEIGTNQIPQLTVAGGLLENMASVVVRDQFFVVEGNEANNNATTDWVLSVRIDSGTTLAFGTQESALATDRYCWWLH